MNNFREFEKIAIQRIALSIFRTTGPCRCFIYCIVDQDEYVRKNVATLIREIAKHTPEVGHGIFQAHIF